MSIDKAKEDVISKLESIGYTVFDKDDFLIGFCISKVESKIRSFCNFRDNEQIPDMLHWTWVDRAVAEFLLNVKTSGKIEGFDLGMAEKSVKEGDTEVVYAVGSGSYTPEQRINQLINSLSNSGLSEMISCRRLKW